MKRIKVVSRKYDGSLREEYETGLYAETDEAFILFSTPGLRYYDHRKAAWFAAPDGLLEIYFKQRWYHVWHVAEQVSNTNLIYVHIAQPAAFQGQTLEWTDLDLDYRVHLDHTVEGLDQAEFDYNARRLNYPAGVIEQVRAASWEVEAGLASRGYPFDYERQTALYWRIKREQSG